MEAPPLFLTAVAYSSGGFADELPSVATADLNGDGKPDVVITNWSSGTVGVLLGNGDGTLQSAVTYNTGGANPAAVAIADLNGDGKPDLVITNWSSGTVGVLLGNGDGTFQAAVTYGSGGSAPESIAVADLNGDGKPDILVANDLSNTVGVLLGNGDGTFQAAVTYGSGGSYADSVAAADVNGDGKPDLVVVNMCSSNGCYYGSTVGVLLGNGNGTFQAAVTYGSGGSYAGGVAVADVNGDGKPDVVVTNGGSAGEEGLMGVLLGNGDGTFQTAVTYDAGGENSWGLAIADVNGDGKPDLLTANNNSGSVSVLLGNGDGTFQPGLTFGSGGALPTSIAVADLNGDGEPDLVVGDTFDPNDYDSTSAAGVLLHYTPTTTTLTSSLNPSVYGQTVTFTAAVSAAVRAPTGTVIFYDSSTAIGSATLANGSASISISSLAGGSHSITAAYQGGGAFGTSTSAVLVQVVNGNTTTSLVSSANPSVYGQAVMFTAAVSAASGTPTGTVIFYDSSTAIGSATLANGSASISISSLVVGSHSITAAYQGSGAFDPSTSAPLNQVVNPATTTTSLQSSLNPALVGDPVTYTATVASQYGGAVTGTVMFQDGGSTVATVTIAGNQASYSTKYSKPGTHSMTGTYSGDTNDTGSVSAALVEQINKGISTRTVLTTSGSPSQINQSVTFTATVRPRKKAIPDGELVTFYDGKTEIGTAATVSGVATFTTSSLKAKTHTIKATYPGDDTFEPSAGSVKQVVEK